MCGVPPSAVSGARAGPRKPAHPLALVSTVIAAARRGRGRALAGSLAAGFAAPSVCCPRGAWAGLLRVLALVLAAVAHVGASLRHGEDQSGGHQLGDGAAHRGAGQPVLIAQTRF